MGSCTAFAYNVFFIWNHPLAVVCFSRHSWVFVVVVDLFFKDVDRIAEKSPLGLDLPVFSDNQVRELWAGSTVKEMCPL